MHPQKKKTLTALRKARSLLDTIVSMAESDAYCVDIMQQNQAAIGLLRGVHQQLLEGHLDHCFANAMHAKDDKRKRAMIEELLVVSKYANK